jgi:hypothetical protein
VDGYFIGCCYDGATMFRALRSVEKGESIGLTIDGDKIWEVTKEYSQTSYDPDISCVGYSIDVYQDSINKTIKEYLVNFTYFTELMKSYGFELLRREDAVKLGIPSSAGMFSELFTHMENEIQQDPKQRSRYGSALSMTPKEKQISFYNRYFVFKKITSVDVEDVFQSVTGVHVFQEKMNRKDTLMAQMVASQMMMEEGDAEGRGDSKGKASYRPTKGSELKIMGDLGSFGDLGSETKISKLFGSKGESSSPSASKTVAKSKSKINIAGVASEASSIKGYSDKDLEKLDKSTPLAVSTLKKKSALAAVKLPESGKVVVETGAAASILEKSKLGMKETSSKLSVEKAKSDKKEKEATLATVKVGEVQGEVQGEGQESKSSEQKDKKKSSKLGSIKLNPSALALLSVKPKQGDL